MSLSLLFYAAAALYAASVVSTGISHARARKAMFCPNQRLTRFGRLLLRGGEGLYLLTQPLAKLKQSLYRHALFLR